jgi:hypothetical protein
METMKRIYLSQHSGIDRQASFEANTKEWDQDEIFAFKNWLKYYEGGDSVKYKTAQINYYIPEKEEINGYFIPNPIGTANREKLQVGPSDVHFSDDIQKIKEDEFKKKKKQETSEEYRNKLIGRILSIRRLLNSNTIDLKELEPILNTLNQLENQFRMLKTIKLASPIYYDLILRQANILKNNGHTVSASIMQKFAQEFVVPVYHPTPSMSKIDTREINALDNEVPVQALDSNNSDDEIELELDENSADDPIEKFLENMQGAGITDKETLSYADDEDDQKSDDFDIVVEAQDAGAPPPPPSAQQPLIAKDPALQEGAEVSLEPEATGIDNILDKALENIKIEDVLNKLEAIADVYKHRELSRQLSTVDIMLHHLGLANFFPELSEASAKSLESNQYVLTRIENVIARLRGSVKAQDIELKPNTNVSPELAGVSNKLKQEEQSEKARKELRKQIQNQETQQMLQQPAQPGLEVELPPGPAQPPEVVQPAPAPPVAPAAQPIR